MIFDWVLDNWHYVVDCLVLLVLRDSTKGSFEYQAMLLCFNCDITSTWFAFLVQCFALLQFLSLCIFYFHIANNLCSMHCETTNSSLLTFIAAMLLSFLGYLQSRQSGFRFPKVGSRWKSLVLRDWRTGMEMSRHWTWSAFAFQGRRQQLHGKSLRAKCSTFFNSKDYLYLYYVHIPGTHSRLVLE